MSDYFLNKIYDSLLSKKPVPKKSEPVVEKKKVFKPLSEILNERYQVKFKKHDDPEYTEIEVSDAQFRQAFRHLQVAEDQIDQYIKEIAKTGLNEKQVREVLRLVFSHDNPSDFFNVFQNKMTIEEYLQQKDIVNYTVNRYKLDRALVSDLLTFEPATKPSTGKGEVFMMLFVQGARKGSTSEQQGSESGDIVVDGVEYEIKGSNARIRGQKGYGSFDAARKAFESSLQELINKSGLEINVTGQSYNISAQSNGFIDSVAAQLIQTGQVTKEDIVNVYASGLNQVYNNATPEQLKGWINKGINNDGKMNSEFKSLYFKFALQYYATQEKFNYIILVGTDPAAVGRPVAAARGGGRIGARFGLQNFISREDIMSGNIEGKIAPDSWPSFLPRAGQGGGVFGVKPVI
jgi:hypothetical protein